MKIETKFDINQDVYFMSKNMVTRAVVQSIEITAFKRESDILFHKTYNLMTYQNEEKKISELYLFKTKDELLKSL